MGLPLTDAEWLLDHHKIKIIERSKYIHLLPIQEGDDVLDVCCGSGQYSSLLAECVGHKGSVVGYDFDAKLLDEAYRRSRTHPLAKNISFQYVDIVKQGSSDKKFDVIFAANFLSYYDNYFDIVQQMHGLLRPGGRLIVKDSDFGYFALAPLPPGLQADIVAAAQRNTARRGTAVEFDNFFGRRIPGILKRCPHRRINVQCWGFNLFSPLSNEEKRYISTNLMTLGTQAKPCVREEDFLEWMRLIDQNGEDSVLNQDDCFFSMSEVVGVLYL